MGWERIYEKSIKGSGDKNLGPRAKWNVDVDTSAPKFGGTRWRQSENVDWRRNIFDKLSRQKANRFYSTFGDRDSHDTGEVYRSPLGTTTSMKVEPEWYHQRGQKIPAQMITPEIMDLYQDEESDYYYNQGGIASLENRPGYFLGSLVGGANFLRNKFDKRYKPVDEPAWGPSTVQFGENQHANEFVDASGGPKHAEEFSNARLTKNALQYPSSPTNFEDEDFFPGMDYARSDWDLPDPGLQDDPTIRSQYDKNKSLRDLYWEGEFGTGIPRPRKNLARMYNPRMRAEGGAVGLQPGILSLMGRI